MPNPRKKVHQMDQGKLRDLFKEFVLDCLVNIHLAIYKQNADLCDAELKNELLINYLNYYFKSILLQNDKTVVDYFSQMQQVGGHSHVCTIQKIFEVTQFTVKTFTVSETDSIDEASFEKVVTEELKSFLIPSLEKVVFEKKCKGPMNLEIFDPERPLFVISKSPKVFYTENNELKTGVLCANCRNVQKEKRKQCSRCKSAVYCSQECQQKHWKDHKKECFEPYYTRDDVKFAHKNSI